MWQTRLERSPLSPMRQALHRLIRWSGLTATRCQICSVILDGQRTRLCADCAKSLNPRKGGYCTGCGSMFGDETVPPSLCGECRHAPPPWDRLYFHGRYAGALRDLILSYKFNNGFSRNSLLSTLAQETFPQTPDRSPDLIIPVPLHRKRLLWRGFNQSTQLARSLGATRGIPVHNDGLIRIRHTPPQTRLGRRERQANIKNAFAADRETVADKAVLLIDDVYTTGATLRECAHTLKRAGAHGVDVLVLARAQQDPA